MRIYITIFIVLFIKCVVAQPVLEWVAIYNGPSNSVDQAKFLKLNSIGEVYISGESEEDYYTIKYSPQGDTLWERRYDGPGDDFDNVQGLVVDKWGNAIVTGDHWVDSLSYTLNNWYTIKYANSSGNTLWANEVPPQYLPNDDDPWDIAVDSSGFVYITGKIFAGALPFGTGVDWLTISYQPAGVLHWQNQWNAPDSLGDEGTSIDVTPGGVAYIVGTTKYNGSNQIRIKKSDFYGPDWDKFYDIEDATSNPWPLIAVDELGNAFVTVNNGYYDEEDVLLLKYDSFGNLEWERTYNGPGDAEDNPVDIEIDNDGNVILTCESIGLGNDNDFCTIKYSTDGDTLWINRFEPANSSPTALCIDKWNNVYITGTPWYTTVKYLANGDEDWVEYYYDGTMARDIEVDDDGNVYVTGYQSGINSHDFCTIKYSQQPSSVENEVSNQPSKLSLLQNYPNPFNPSTKIKFTIPGNVILSEAKNLTTLKVYDVLGNEITTLVNEELSAGEYEVEFNPYRHSREGGNPTSGVYFYQLRTENFTETKKMMLLK